jgi:hypothetical protein
MSNTRNVDDVEAIAFSNRLAEEVVFKIVNDTLNRGGAASDILIVCESVVVGLIFACLEPYDATATPGAPERLLVALTTRLKERLVEISREGLSSSRSKH